MFEDLFPSRRGRPSVPPEVIASVLVLQSLHGLSDREAVEALTFDLRWKAACGYAVDAAGFHASTLTYWRRRLAASDRPQRIFDAVRAVIAETGVLAGKTRRALDSTILDDAVARQDTVTQLIAAIGRVDREVGAAAGQVAAVCTRLPALCGQDYSTTRKPPIAWDDEAAQAELVSALVEDATALLAVLDVEAITAAGGRAGEAVALLALVAGQDVEPADDSDGTDGRWQIARRTAPDRVISTVDPQARHAHKTQSRQQDGFKAHIIVEPDTGLITAAALTQAAGPANSDAAVGQRLIVADPTIGDDHTGIEVLGDSAYGTGQMLATLNAQRFDAVVKPWPIRPAVEGGFDLDDFVYDAAAGTLTCPAGHTRTVTARGQARFGGRCGPCPLRDQCTSAASGRAVTLGEHHLLQREHRQRFTDPRVQDIYRTHRPMVERSIAWLTRGARKVPFRGVVKNDQWLHHRVAGLNLRRLINLGLTNQNGTWALA